MFFFVCEGMAQPPKRDLIIDIIAHWHSNMLHRKIMQCINEKWIEMDDVQQGIWIIDNTIE